jgi:putative SOS response-associated peptidase YedK
MPFILQRKQEDMWLREIGNGVVSLVQTQMGAEEMKYHAVTPKMNKVAFENPQAIEPIPEPSLGL